MTSDFNVKAYRALFDQFIGALIDSIIGGSRLDKIFEGDNDVQEQNEQTSSGMIVLDLGIVTENTKVALLIAQAAERIARLAEKTQTLVEHKEEIEKEDWEEWGYIAHDDPLFRYVGSKDDHPYLRMTQAAWQIAQIYYNQVLHQKTGDQDDEVELQQSDFHGFMKEAAIGYKRASLLIHAEGHEEVSANMDHVSSSLMQKTVGKDGHDIQQIVTNIIAYQMLHAPDETSEDLVTHRALIVNLKRLLSLLSEEGGHSESDKAASNA